MPKLLKSFFCSFFWLWDRKYNILPLSTDFWISCKIKWLTLHNIMKMSLFYHLTHQEVQRHLSLFQPHPTMPQLFLEFFSFSCVSFLNTLDANRNQKFWLLSTTWKISLSFFFTCLYQNLRTRHSTALLLCFFSSLLAFRHYLQQPPWWVLDCCWLSDFSHAIDTWTGKHPEKIFKEGLSVAYPPCLLLLFL